MSDARALKEEYESLRAQIGELEARRKLVAGELKDEIRAGRAPDGAMLLAVQRITIPDPAGLLRALVHAEVDEEAMDEILARALSLNAAVVAAILENAPAAVQALAAPFFAVETSERLDVR